MVFVILAVGCALFFVCDGATNATTEASTTTSGDSAELTKCGATVLDQATGDLIFFGSGPLAPTSAEELSRECTRLRSSLDAITKYANNCSEALGQVMIKMFAEAADKELTYRCDGKGKEEYLKLTPCLVEKSGPTLHKCNVRFSGYLQTVVDQPKEDQIPLACCYQTRFERCVMKAAKQCGEEHAKFSAKVMASMSEELKDTACRKWVRDPSQCKSLPKITPVKNPKYLTMLPSLVAILDSI